VTFDPAVNLPPLYLSCLFYTQAPQGPQQWSTFMVSYTRVPLAISTLALVLACSGEQPEVDEMRDLTLAPAESVATIGDLPEPEVQPTPAPQTQTRQPPRQQQQTPPRQTQPQQQQPAPRQPEPRRAAALPTVSAGTAFNVYATDTLASGVNKVGDAVTATLGADILDAGGKLVIPAGAVFMGSIAQIAPAPNPDAQGTLVIAFNQVAFGGKTYQAICAMNPAYPLREPKLEIVFKFDMNRVNKVLEKKWTPHKITPIINPTVPEALEPFYNPKLIGNDVSIELHGSDNSYKGNLKIASVSGGVITLQSPTTQDILVGWHLRCSPAKYVFESSGFGMYGSDSWTHPDAAEGRITDRIDAGNYFCVKLFTSNEEGERILIVNYICDKAF